MGRKSGSRNADYALSRDSIVGRLTAAIIASSRYNLSFNEFARLAGSTPSTLRHYLGDREGALGAALSRLHEAGAPYLAEAASSPRGPPALSLRWFLDELCKGWRAGAGRAHALGLAEGLGHRLLGEAYLAHLLEPTLQAAEARIARHVADGELDRCDLRHAALELVGPVVLALLHQDALGGTAVRPLEIERFLDDHLVRFLRSYAAPSPGPA